MVLYKSTVLMDRCEHMRPTLICQCPHSKGNVYIYIYIYIGKYGKYSLHGASRIYSIALQLSHGGKSLQCNTPVLKDVDPRV